MMKRFLPLIISVLLFGIFLLLPARLFSSLVNENAVMSQRLALTDTVLKGTLNQDYMMQSKQFLPIYGSSELGKVDPFHPGLILNTRKSFKPTPFLVGTGGSTDLVNAVELGAQYDKLKGKKLVFIISPQWFTEHGLTKENFDARISKTQINQLFKQKKLSQPLKQAYAERLQQFKHVENRPFLKAIAQQKAEPHTNYLTSFYSEQLKKIEAIKSLLHFNKSELLQADGVANANADWSKMKQAAIQYGQKHSASNAFGIRDEYWKLIKSHKRKINRDYEFKENSPEFKDLELLVRTLKEAGADVTYVSLPSNGKWYDHIGIKQERREQIYQKINQTVTDNGGELYDMTDKDYEDYVIADAVHVGWKGWVYINEYLDQHVK
ncbi:D-alanyl-lipoteichoic acid biosynthesis protein DltD [Staphylococcus auricularis]|uniref:D-alanyl-lipoteichoic acid biosynthesis protein DltD n=1 Tax=Staphylococcus auricularis TaxID=29379 RepID=UPI001EF32A39|nr:D-alanyl-lipoteichoic acid biosynthesis protein DltD [Staphylococcus auricularis]MCG7342317.1 D-alanyl-lipoteichoic acid biosynthesis protein DltD [Staphylococcus auricularis]